MWNSKCTFGDSTSIVARLEQGKVGAGNRWKKPSLLSLPPRLCCHKVLSSGGGAYTTWKHPVSLNETDGGAQFRNGRRGRNLTLFSLFLFSLIAFLKFSRSVKCVTSRKKRTKKSNCTGEPDLFSCVQLLLYLNLDSTECTCFARSFANEACFPNLSAGSEASFSQLGGSCMLLGEKRIGRKYTGPFFFSCLIRITHNLRRSKVFVLRRRRSSPKRPLERGRKGENSALAAAVVVEEEEEEEGDLFDPN